MSTCHARAPGASNDRSSRERGGHKLERWVSLELTKLGVANRRMEPDSIEDRDGKTDLIVMSPWTHHPFRIQITLRRKQIRKMQQFVRAMLENFRTRGHAVYVEIVAARQANLPEVARRVARAIREIVTRFRNFGHLRLLGVRVHATSGFPLIEKFEIDQVVTHAWISETVDTILARRAQEAPPPKIDKPIPFWRKLVEEGRERIHNVLRHASIPPSAFVSTQRHTPLFRP